MLQFLRDRGVPERSLEEMQEEKVDMETIKSIDDVTLARFVPKLGDRIALKNFCRQPKPSPNPKGKRALLFEVLKSKVTKACKNESLEDCDETKDEEESLSSGKGKKSRKMTRKIEIGWIHNGKQVRKRTGGGTRKLDMMRSAKKSDILQAGKQLFFPEGISTKGPETDFDFDVLDFKETQLPAQVTIGDCYEKFKTGILTFYLHTEEVEKVADVTVLGSSEDELPDTGILSPQGVTEKKSPRSATGSHTGSVNISQTQPTTQINKQDSMPSTSQTNQIDILAEAASAIGDLPIEQFSLPDLSDSEIFFNFAQPQDRESDQDISTFPKPSVEITIHRGPMAFTELCGYFKDPSILGRMINVIRILPSGERERAEDAGGVMKDTIAEFWEDFYCKCTIGRDVKIPCLRHDFGEEEWKAVGRILVYGWTEFGYWPIALSKVFLSQCLYPGKIVIKDELMSDFYGFAAIPDKEIFTNATNDFASIDEDDLLEALDSHDCKTKVTSNNFLPVLQEIAHKEIVQTPMFVCDCWRQVLAEICISEDRLNQLYISLLPTNKNVSKLLHFPTALSGQDEEVFRFLKRYVKELDEKKLRAFLRFCTGSDVLNTNRISVELVCMKDFERRPVGHTCGCLLQLGHSYSNFMEFRNEFNCVLESNVWVMDVV